MIGPADTDPLVALAAAVEHVSTGRADEIELEWWADPDDGPEHRFTITVSNMNAVYTREHPTPAGVLDATPPADPPPPAVAPDDLSSLDDLP